MKILKGQKVKVVSGRGHHFRVGQTLRSLETREYTEDDLIKFEGKFRGEPLTQVLYPEQFKIIEEKS